MEEVTYYTAEFIQNEFDRLSFQNQSNILYHALDYMQQYNGRSKFLCIAMAMGYENFEGDNVSFFKK